VGGSQLTQGMIDADMLDELILFFMPILLGDGVPLFAKRETMKFFNLVESKAFPKGTLMVQYEKKKK
jgi:dihydrofolate reductase